MKLLLLSWTVLATSLALADAPGMTLKDAKAENVMLYLQFGRKNCETCQVLKGWMDNDPAHLHWASFCFSIDPPVGPCDDFLPFLTGPSVGGAKTLNPDVLEWNDRLAKLADSGETIFTSTSVYPFTSIKLF